MQRLFLTLIFSFFCFSAFTQHIYKIKTDSLLVTNDSCTAELNLENSTKFVNGFLYNKGKGRTEFRRAMIKLTDSTYLFGADTLNFRSLLNTIGFSGSNIYNSNGSLTGNRMLTLNSYSLSFQNGTNIVEHIFPNGNKWLGNGTPVDEGNRLALVGSMQIENGSIKFKNEYNNIAIVNNVNYIATGSGNTIVGPRISSLLSIGGSDNILIGREPAPFLSGSPVNDYTIASGNIILGRGAANGLTTGSGNVVIGTFVARETGSVAFPIGNSSYKFVLGGGKAEYVGGSAHIMLFGDFLTKQLIVNPTNGVDNPVINGSVQFGINSTSRGFLPPRMTAINRLNISSPAIGLQVYQTDSNEGQYVKVSSGWQRFLTDADIGTTISSNNIYNANGALTGNRVISSNGYNLTLTGDLTVGSGSNAIISTNATNFYNDGLATGAGNYTFRNWSNIVFGSPIVATQISANSINVSSNNTVMSVAGSGVTSFRIGNTASSSTWFFETHRNAPSGSLEISNSIENPGITLFQDRNMGIGTYANNGYKLDVNGTGRFQTSLTTPVLNTASVNAQNNGTLSLGAWGGTQLQLINGNILALSPAGTGFASAFGVLTIRPKDNTYATIHIDYDRISRSASILMGSSDGLTTIRPDTYGSKDFSIRSRVWGGSGGGYYDAFYANNIGQVLFGNLQENIPTIHSSAVLQIDGTGYSGAIRGFLPPRMTTTQGNAISSPAEGLTWYDTDKKHNVYHDGSVVTYDSKVSIGTSAPSSVPTSVGQIFVDTVNKKAYISTGTSSSSDWTILN